MNAGSWSLWLVVALSGGANLLAGEVDIFIDGKSPGRTFEGLGALSAGASSRLLWDYPEPYRGEILDLLFKPKFGASLQHLKVEIGGDVNSTDGSEPSHAASREEWEHPRPEYCRRGYEWWLMEEAKKRNPNILLEGLQWGAPGWIGNGTFYSQDNIEFIIAFIQGAKRYHDLEMDYQGVRNEVRYDPAWIKRLRQALDDHGLGQVKIVAADLWPPEDQWVIAQDMAKDAGLNQAVAVLNAHVPEMVNFHTPPEARRLNKPLWDGEAHAYGGDWYAAADYARYNRAYPLGQITKIINWSLITAYPDFLVAPASGPMKANTPWFGHYEVQPPLWMMAHTTQFVEPGWKYLDRSCRFFNSEGGLGAGWSLNALKSPTTDDYSLIIETMDAKEPWTLRCRLSEDLSTRDLAVWRSVFNQDLFIRRDDVPVRNREFRLTVIPNAIYSLTTTRGQQMGRPAHAVPDPKPFPFPFATDFEHDPVGGPAKYLCDQHGTFEIAPRPDGPGQCLVQTMTRQGITWRGGYSFAQTIVGDIGWSDYRVSVEAMLPEQGSLMLWGRMNRFGWEDGAPFAADQFEVKDDGRWTLKARAQVLSSGQVAPLGHNWHSLGLAFKGTEITAVFDQQALAKVEDASCRTGVVGLGTGWNRAFFDNLSISRVP